MFVIAITIRLIIGYKLGKIQKSNDRNFKIEKYLCKEIILFLIYLGICFLTTHIRLVLIKSNKRYALTKRFFGKTIYLNKT